MQGACGGNNDIKHPLGLDETCRAVLGQDAVGIQDVPRCSHPAPHLHHVVDEGLDGAVADEDEVAVQDRPTQVVKSTPASEPHKGSARYGHAGSVDTAWSYSMVRHAW